jgi:hypothetical protein
MGAVQLDALRGETGASASERTNDRKAKWT